MKNRHVFSAPDIRTAQAGIRAARQAGIDEADLSLVARSDIELEDIPDRQKQASTDFKPAAMRGAAAGGATGLLAGLVAVAFPPLGVTLAGAAIMTVGGALVGTWAAALVGSTVESPLRRKFEEEIEQGRILVVVDADDETLERAGPGLRESGVTPLQFETPSALS